MRGAANVVVVTGAGVSAESGIDTYRGAGGLWEKHDVNEVATASALRRDPAKVWRFLLLLREHIAAASPNAAHRAIAALEDRVATVRVITQNIDGLHQAAGSRTVLEIHGNVREARDPETGAIHALGELDLERLPPLCPRTGRVLRPNVLYFEEAYDPEIMGLASRWVRQAEVILIVGTSGMVPTPYFLAWEGKSAGAFVIDVNLDRSAPMFTFGTELADLFLQGKAGVVLPQVVALI
ncbi:MAG: NAD-dependent protein deacylase [Planctomycetes bacterium]|nr:NAD-dependent protein deacylase [Planctomycetota bacterium]